MALSKADLAAIAELIDARITAAAPARARVAQPTETPTELRARAAGGVCEVCGQHFMTANGKAFHDARVAKGQPH